MEHSRNSTLPARKILLFSTRLPAAIKTAAANKPSNGIIRSRSLLVYNCFPFSFQRVDDHAVAQLRLAPGRFGRHDFIGVRHQHHFFNRGRIQSKGYDGPAGLDQPAQFGHAADAADKTDPLVGTRVLDAQQRCQQIVLQYVYV